MEFLIQLIKNIFSLIFIIIPISLIFVVVIFTSMFLFLWLMGIIGGVVWAILFIALLMTV